MIDRDVIIRLLEQNMRIDGDYNIDGLYLGGFDETADAIIALLSAEQQPPAQPERATGEWEDGAPQNIEAAALDALEWLEVFQKLIKAAHSRQNIWREAGERLDGCIASLKAYLPQEPQ